MPSPEQINAIMTILLSLVPVGVVLIIALLIFLPKFCNSRDKSARSRPTKNTLKQQDIVMFKDGANRRHYRSIKVDDRKCEDSCTEPDDEIWCGGEPLSPDTDVPEEPPPVTGSVASDIRSVCREVADMVIDKNSKYGNSALDPVRIFSDADKTEALRVRIDDKLSRLARGTGDNDEDTMLDLIGYLVLLRVAERRQQEGE